MDAGNTGLVRIHRSDAGAAAAVPARLDNGDLPCCLETLDEKNASLCEHFGFRLPETTKIPGTELVNWAMLRETAK
jgi:hypothetical protein